MNNYFVILAAGKSTRFHKIIPKQFYNYKNKEIIDHSIEKSLNSKLFKKILVVTNNLKYLKKKKISKISKNHQRWKRKIRLLFNWIKIPKKI